MKYSTFVPNPSLQHLVECYWLVEGSDVDVQKIIPDGYLELIFHYEDPFQPLRIIHFIIYRIWKAIKGL